MIQLFTRSLNRYAGIAGVQQFVQKSLEFVYGEHSEALSSRRVAAIQSISGTGALRVAGELAARLLRKRKIFLPAPTWSNHQAVFQHCGLETEQYAYYDPLTKKLDFARLRECVELAPGGSLFLLHACAHNPTGCDPTPEQWNQLSLIFKLKQHLVIFDNAYQVRCVGCLA